MTLTELKKMIRHNPNTEYISGYKSWQTEIATKQEKFADSKVTERRSVEETKEWVELNDLCRKSLREQEELNKIKEEFK